MCGGSPKVDNSIQLQQMQEAADARRREEERQARIRAGSGAINAMFGGGVVGDGVLGADAVWNPTGTYYLADGSIWKPADESAFTTNPKKADQVTATPRTAEQQFAEMLKNGMLYTGTKQVSGFDDSFFNAREDAYMDFYQPQLDDQFKSAGDQLTFALARAGTLNSTVAADKQADLQKQYGVQQASILSQAKDAVNQQRARVNSEKSALLSQLNATGDANMASNEALARTQQLFGQQPAYNALPDIFSGVAAGIGNWANNQANRTAYNSYFGSGGGNNTRIIGG